MKVSLYLQYYVKIMISMCIKILHKCDFVGLGPSFFERKVKPQMSLRKCAGLIRGLNVRASDGTFSGNYDKMIPFTDKVSICFCGNWF